MLYQFRFVFVIALLIFAALLATEKGKLPLALRGLKRMLRKDRDLPPQPEAVQGVPLWKRLLAFVLVLISFLIAVI